VNTIIGSFGARLTHDHSVPSDEWVKIPFNEVPWDTAGWFDPEHGAFVAESTISCDFLAGGGIVVREAVNMVRLGFAIYKNGVPEVVNEGLPSGYPALRYRVPIGLGTAVRTERMINARPGDVFELYVRHDVGIEVPLGGTFVPEDEDPQLSPTTVAYFMGIYEGV
jgi:hypothetical protein